MSRLAERVTIDEDQLKEGGILCLEAYVETNPETFNKEDFLNLTKNSEKGKLVNE